MISKRLLKDKSPLAVASENFVYFLYGKYNCSVLLRFYLYSSVVLGWFAYFCSVVLRVLVFILVVMLGQFAYLLCYYELVFVLTIVFG